MLSDIPLRVLIYFEDDEWVAHLLEMDLVGTGDSPQEAEQQLKGAAAAQLSFCREEGVNPFRPAPKNLFRIWNETQKKSLNQAMASPGLPLDMRRRVSMFTPPKKVSQGHKFKRRAALT